MHIFYTNRAVRTSFPRLARKTQNEASRRRADYFNHESKPQGDGAPNLARFRIAMIKLYTAPVVESAGGNPGSDALSPLTKAGLPSCNEKSLMPDS